MKKGKVFGFNQFFSCLVHMQGFLLPGLKTFNCGNHVHDLGCFVFLFMYILIRYFIVCTVMPFVVPPSEVLFLLLR